MLKRFALIVMNVLYSYYAKKRAQTHVEFKNVGMGLWIFVLVFLVPFFFMAWHPYIPLHFIEMVFNLFYSFFIGWAKALSEMRCFVLVDILSPLPHARTYIHGTV